MLTHDITRIIKGKFEGCWESYGEENKHNPQLANLWYEEFKVERASKIHVIYIFFLSNCTLIISCNGLTSYNI